MTAPEKYKRQIAARLQASPDQINLYWKGRVALYALLKAMGIQSGDEVIVPAFTCVVVPNAILYLGAKPVYVDIYPQTLNTTLDHIKQAVTPATKCIIIQNTFGLSCEVEEIITFARSSNIQTIEDCTHGFGGLYNGQPNGSYCDAAFYSTQWNKPFSTGIGGFSLVKNSELQTKVEAINAELISPSLKQRKVLSALIQFRKYLIHDSTYWTLLKLYRYLSKTGLVVGSSSDDELTTIQQPEKYFMSASEEQIKAGVKALPHLESDLALRKRNGFAYNDYLRTKGKWNYPDHVLSNHSFLKFPIFVKDREKFLLLAEKNKIRLGDWFLSPIHPVPENFRLWELQVADFPVAEERSAHILNLPTDTNNCERVLQFLEQHIDELIE